MGKTRAHSLRRRPQVGSIDADLPSRSVHSLAQDLGPVVYYIRTKDDLVKIGYTSDIRLRIYRLGGSWDRLLALVPGTLADEQALHQTYRPHRARGHEYYWPATELLDHIDGIRDRMGAPPVERWVAAAASA